MSLPGRYAESYATFPLSEGAGPPAAAGAAAAAAEQVAPYGERFLAWRAEGGAVELFVAGSWRATSSGPSS